MRMRVIAVVTAALLASGCAHRGTWRAKGVVPGRGVATTEDIEAVRLELSDTRESLEAQAVVQEELHARIAGLEGQVTDLSDMPPGGSEPWELYEVKKGQSLWSIANKLWGDPYKWVRLYDANRDRLDDPDRLYPGQLLRVPPEPAAETLPPDPGGAQ